ncbi:hypothetical protein PMAA_099710 [Talaromyces marneffei ATCC 18224]|uniref:Uncharacterized protein n=1 Tax=Talaromyces marneffei (strain ATCC 18224 / CBS 334.59 / QM 7333) TaxID=441960 RepID=B6QJ43_TALMQ|nr:hypothetical protein PMAA_099710 [Talaromyces marneffei ATCC 18224]
MDGVELNHHGVLLEHIEHIEHSEPSEEQLKKDWMGVSWTPVTPVGKNGVHIESSPNRQAFFQGTQIFSRDSLDGATAATCLSLSSSG